MNVAQSASVTATVHRCCYTHLISEVLHRAVLSDALELVAAVFVRLRVDPPALHHGERAGKGGRIAHARRIGLAGEAQVVLLEVGARAGDFGHREHQRARLVDRTVAEVHEASGCGRFFRLLVLLLLLSGLAILLLLWLLLSLFLLRTLLSCVLPVAVEFGVDIGDDIASVQTGRRVVARAVGRQALRESNLGRVAAAEGCSVSVVGEGPDREECQPTSAAISGRRIVRSLDVLRRSKHVRVPIPSQCLCTHLLHDWPAAATELDERRRMR